MKHMLIAQSGGPSAAINATVAGVVERCMTSDKVDRIYGAVNGIKGVINGNFIDLTDTLASPEQLELLCHTPAAALGSCRLKLNNAHLKLFFFFIILFFNHNFSSLCYFREINE